jgi:hypothetical protein
MSLDVTLGEPFIECPYCVDCFTDDGELFSANITHNLGKMADAAGIYKACWCPEELGITQAKDLIPILTEGLNKLKFNPGKYKKYDAENGWGLYEHFVPWVEEYLNACIEYPTSTISVSR